MLLRCAMVSFYLLAGVCAALFLSILVVPRPWIGAVLVAIWACIGAAAVALLVVHVMPGPTED